MKKNLLSYSIYLSVSLLGFASCKVETLKDKGYDTKAIAEGIEDRKVKRITKEQLFQWVEAMSDTMFAPMCQRELEKSLWKASNNASTISNVSWQEFYKTQKFYQRDSLAKKYLINIQLLDLKDTTSLKKFSGKEKQVLEAYQYEFLSQKKIAKNVQKLDSEGSEILVCIPAEVSDKYNLASWNLKKQDVLGVWAIRFTKKDAIRRVNMKQLFKNTQK
jgi:hypothetical protein